MNNEILVKYVNPQFIEKELIDIGFDSSYRHHAIKKNTIITVKIFNLRPQEASILKQSALALGFDACVHRGVLDCSIEFSDALLSGSLVQFQKLCASLERQPFKLKKVSLLIKELITKELSPIKLKNITLDWSKPYIMGILNITPNSFSDGGKYFELENALSHFQQLIEDGVDIIDIGAESTHPNNAPILEEEEISRLKPFLDELKQLNLSVPISIDTRNFKTAKIAIEKYGIDIINDVGDVRTNEYNNEMISLVNSNNTPYIYTSNRQYDEKIIDRIYQNFYTVIQKVTAPIILDVGIGFGKTIEQNYELIDRVKEFKSLFKPLLVGHSRKSFLSKSFNLNQDELDKATSAISSKLILDGVNILRVHNVKNTKLTRDVLSKFVNFI